MKFGKLIIGSLLIIALVLVALPLIGGCGVDDSTQAPERTPESVDSSLKVFHLRAQTQFAPEDPTHKGEERWAQLLYDMSNGRIDIEVFPEGTMVGTKEIPEAVSQGVIDIGFCGQTYMAGTIPAATVATGILLSWRGPADMDYVYHELGFLKEMREACAENNVYYLGPVAVGDNALWATKPVRNVEDFQGMSIRAYGVFNELFNLLGAKTVSIPHSESYIALTTGTIDGYFTTPTVGVSYKHYEVAPYLMEPPLVSATSIVNQINLDVWNSFPDDIKAMFEVAQRWSLYDQYHSFQTDYINSVASNFEVVQMSEELIDKIMEVGPTLWEAQAKDARSKKMVEILKEFCETRY